MQYKNAIGFLESLEFDHEIYRNSSKKAENNISGIIWRELPGRCLASFRQIGKVPG